jgi:exosortase A-associated hydrolase 1
MGDSEGEARTFEDVEDDLLCAIDKFLVEVPSVSEVVIWGLCDAASAAIFYACKDSRISGLVLLNPWVRTESGSARAYLKHYYVSRLFQPEFWSKIRHGNLNIMAATRSLLDIIAEAVAGRKKSVVGVPDESRDTCSMPPLPDRMFSGLSRFRGKILVILSGNDLTAQEFSDLVKSSRQWRKLLTSSRVTGLSLPEANHTFSRREWRDQVAIWTKDWIYSW